MVIEVHIATIQSLPVRLQEYGVGIFATVTTKSALKKALKKELIFVDERVATTATFIKGGERIELKAIDNSEKPRLVLDLEVVFEDEYLAIVNKPAGILTSGNRFKTVANALTQNLLPSAQKDAVSPQPVHRLDYATTGLLAIGKTSSSILALGKLFEARAVVKSYIAVTIGAMETNGTIRLPIDTKEAESHFEVLQTISSKRFGFLNLVKLYPRTGRRHQLRKHSAFSGNPILGDVDYGRPNLILKGKGLYLHAHSLAFRHPFTGIDMLWELPPPMKFGKLFDIE
ncbi:RluA family pseudouridine synthase [Aggregatimonas sangjinii]|uniref:RluA family pseudouridine synthase n=1 Tax=Aggregatimonas sangjinii TaxID=2583587 RepID=A0A5B7SPM3_9FLAO|nr:RluA family pseudouridine synthase [Aggregatimonas sangjinii]QCX00142.1 RluA family pseudouridine synthase [Aggregatimonas sangjinii]